MAEGKPRRCPACGKALRDDCDGTGRVAGGLGASVWLPVKAYRKCPQYKRDYRQRGQGVQAIFDEGQKDKQAAIALLTPATWRALTRIKLRTTADVNAAPTGDYLKPYEKFEVEDVVRIDGRHYLRLAEKDGWAFDVGVAGRWVGRPICERVGGVSI